MVVARIMTPPHAVGALCPEGAPRRTLRAQGPPPVIRAPWVNGSHMCDPYGWMREHGKVAPVGADRSEADRRKA